MISDELKEEKKKVAPPNTTHDSYDDVLSGTVTTTATINEQLSVPTHKLYEVRSRSEFMYIPACMRVLRQKANVS